jgi:hypothetical protein
VRRQKPTANQLFAESLKDRLFVTPTTFDKAYPTVASIRVTGKQVGDGVGTSKYNDGTVHLTEARQFVDCRNPQCYGGGFPIGQTIEFMIQHREMHREVDYVSCAGHEGSKRKDYGHCCNALKNVVIDVEYRAEAPGAPASG